eukprot:590389-Pyramimonas_sp.AAC.1
MVVALVEARLVDEVLLALGAKLAAPVPPVFVAVELVVVHAETGKGRTRERRRRTRRRLASAIVVEGKAFTTTLAVRGGGSLPGGGVSVAEGEHSAAVEIGWQAVVASGLVA